MDQAELFAKFRAASRRAMVAALLLVSAIAIVVGWQVRELRQIEASIQAQNDRLDALNEQKASLTEELRALTVDPTGGVRASARRVDVDSVLYDFSIWIETSSLPHAVREVRYEFPGSPFDAATSRLASNGFARTFRASDCPERAIVRILFENDETQLVDYEFCDKMIEIKSNRS